MEWGDRIVLTGMILKGRYCVLERIGSGGGGSLYLARDIQLGTLWAVKEIPADRKREAKLLRLLEHPGLPRMVDYLEKGEFCYLVMEYIRGKSLGTWLKEGRRFSLEDVLRMGTAAAEILEYLHGRKPPVYYGDLKPDNLMLTENGKLCLVDLGSAVFGYTSRQKVCMGTRGYAAPEQYEGVMDASSDVYAFGRTLWSLCGKNAWRYAVLRPAFGRLLFRCGRKQPRKRWPDMRAVRTALEEIGESGGGKGLWRIVLLALMIPLLAGVIFLTRPEAPLEESLLPVTDLYYQKSFLGGDPAARAHVCETAEERFQELLKRYAAKDDQRKLLCLLALNSELCGDPGRAAFYYEQLLLYDPACREVYGEYGSFLVRRGQWEESEALYARYREKEKEGVLEEADTLNLTRWEEMICERQEEKISQTENM